MVLVPGDAGVVGASGAIFGLFAAYFVIVQRGSAEMRPSCWCSSALNLVIGFLLPGISWQAHLGGVVVGALVALVLRVRPGAGRSSACRWPAWW